MDSQKRSPAKTKARPATPEFVKLGRRNNEAWGDVARREEIVLQRAMNRAMMDPNIQPRDKILLRMRTDAEGDARLHQYSRSAYTPCSLGFPSGQIRPAHDAQVVALSCFNKTIGLYILDDRQRFPYVEALALETWLWRQWFKPYSTDIEAERTFVRIFAAKYDVEGYKGSGPDSPPLVNGPLRGPPWGYRHASVVENEYWRHTLLIQPLFRAIFMVLVPPDDRVIPGPRGIKWVADIQARLVLTGITEGLSAPISFEEIREYSKGTPYVFGDQTITTTLGVATEFILRLEQREINAFGILPNICRLTTDISPPWKLSYREKAKLLGWIEERDGRLDELSPRSSEWVNRTIFPRWLGNGALYTMQRMRDLLEHGGCKKPQPYTEDWWWDPEELPELDARDREAWERIADGF
ncbi:hypothetical protein GGR51DRAFT_554654 [Nemania sp. FL0031]|nr:hypothetical protein GGR51DRAFT_554654 [Nemania sp. FL0031]